MTQEGIFEYVLQYADTSLVLGHRLSEECGHGPALEVDMALTNIALDLIGQSRNYYQYAAELEGKGRSEDDMAMLRDERAYRNVLLVEQPNEDFAHIIVRQFLFDAFHFPFLQQLQQSSDERLAAIAAKSLKEVSYHLRYSSQWVKRLGDGTEESQRRMQKALDWLWPYVEELHTPSKVDEQAAAAGFGVDLEKLKAPMREKITATLAEARLKAPEGVFGQTGGKEGRHTEHLGYILAEMQWMQRAYPGLQW